jgi:uncharacterized phage-associated protein
MAKYSASDIAKRFLELAKQDDDYIPDISNMKLQKLVFVAQLMSVRNGIEAPLHSDETQAWDYGPVEPKLYKLIKKIDLTNLTLTDEGVAHAFSKAQPIDDPESEKIIRFVWDKFKNWTAVQLSALTHRKNSPWYVVYTKKRSGVIPLSIMHEKMFGDA